MIVKADPVDEKALRAMTYNLLIEWYENEVYLGKATYAKDKAKRSKQSVEIPEEAIRSADPLAQARRERPWCWNTQTTRDFVTYDAKGEEVVLTETISIVDTFGPGPRESRRQLRSREPDGRHFITPEFTSPNPERTRLRINYMRRIHMAIQQIDNFAPTYVLVLTWYLSGMSLEAIANRLTKMTKEAGGSEKTSKGTVEKWYEAALTWVMGCIAQDPIWREHEKEFRQVLKAHVKEEKSRRFDTIWDH